jgi:acetyl-CoA carboxylase carboxyltransferase component
VIHPKETRKRIISALDILETKKEAGRSWKKHGNMPT